MLNYFISILLIKADLGFFKNKFDFQPFRAPAHNSDYTVFAASSPGL